MFFELPASDSPVGGDPSSIRSRIETLKAVRSGTVPRPSGIAVPAEVAGQRSTAPHELGATLPCDVVLPSQAITALAESDPKRALEASRLRHETDATALGRALADRVDRLAEQATCPDPLRRFRDAAEFAAALRSAG